MAINRSALTRKSALQVLEKLQDATTKKSYKDDRFWTLKQVAGSKNADKNAAAAVIRFLPAKTEEGLPYVKTYNHGFQYKGKWFIEDCPSTVGHSCPVCEDVSKLFDRGDKENGRQRKKKQVYIANILVVKHPGNPADEGKTFLYKVSKTIIDKLTDKMHPDEALGDEPRDPFAFFDGCEVKLKRHTADNGFPSYDKTTVDDAGDLFDGDEEQLTELLEKMVDLQEFVQPSRFKSAAEIAKRYFSVVGGTERDEADDEGESPAANVREFGKPQLKRPAPVAKAPVEKDEDEAPAPKAKPAAKAVELDEEEDDDLAFFKQLADE